MAGTEVDNLYEAAKHLSVEQKAELVKKLLGSQKETTLSGKSYSSVNAETVY